MLGVQRNSVSIVANAFQLAKLIHYRRGTIEIVNLEGLKASACECYGVVETHYSAWRKATPKVPLASGCKLMPLTNPLYALSRLHLQVGGDPSQHDHERDSPHVATTGICTRATWRVCGVAYDARRRRNCDV